MRFLAGLLVLVFLLPATLSGQSGSVSLPIGSEGPSAQLQDLDGNTVELNNYTNGKPALIEFWASWCEQCEALQPQLDEIQSSYGDRMNIVAVAVGVSQSVRRVKRHLEEHDPGYPFLWDARGAAVRAYDATTTSIVVMLDEQCNVAYTGVGPSQDLIEAAHRIMAP